MTRGGTTVQQFGHLFLSVREKSSKYCSIGGRCIVFGRFVNWPLMSVTLLVKKDAKSAGFAGVNLEAKNDVWS